jgi:hypothetical protein
MGYHTGNVWADAWSGLVNNTIVKNHDYDSCEIHITTKGNKVIGVLKKGGKIIKKAEARCHPSDNFDFNIGAHTVVQRLFDNSTSSPKVNLGKEDFRRSFVHRIRNLERNLDDIYSDYKETFDKDFESIFDNGGKFESMYRLKNTKGDK